MAPPPRRYSPDFMQQAVELYVSVAEHRSMKDVADDLGIHVNNLRRWVRRTMAPSEEQGRQLGDAERAELLRLRKENRILKEELDISKKAAAFFARDRSR